MAEDKDTYGPFAHKTNTGNSYLWLKHFIFFFFFANITPLQLSIPLF